VSQFPRLDVLPAAQRALWSKLADVARFPFVLYGGTAVALYLAHRESVDFDFFSHRPFQPDELFDSYSFLQGAEVLQSEPNTLTVVTSGSATDNVKISFFGGLKFGRLQRPKKTSDGVMMIASPEDLLSHKLKTLLQRVELKDYLDIDALLQNGLSLTAGLGGASSLFAAFAPQECLKALTYFEDEALGNLPLGLEERLLSVVKNVRSIPTVKQESATLAD
jgi:hypothetical protein